MQSTYLRRPTRLLVRAIVLVNFAILGVDWVPWLGVPLNDALRRVHLYDVLGYGLIASTLALPVLLLAEAGLALVEYRVSSTPRKLLARDRGLLIDAVLTIAWLLTIIVGVVRHAAGFA